MVNYELIDADLFTDTKDLVVAKTLLQDISINLSSTKKSFQNYK